MRRSTFHFSLRPSEHTMLAGPCHLPRAARHPTFSTLSRWQAATFLCWVLMPTTLRLHRSTNGSR